jgi:SAM-dependent methyltransferase
MRVYTSDQQSRIENNRNAFITQKDWLEKLPKNFKTILDVGSGAGFASKFFADRGHKVTALDIDLDVFQFRDEIDCVQLDLSDFHPEKKFDAIFFSHTLEHIPNTAQVITRLRELLNDGGYLFIIVPGYLPWCISGHWHIGWNVGQLGGWLVGSGFDCRKSTFMQIGWNVCGFGIKRPDHEVGSSDMWQFSVPEMAKWMPAGIEKFHYFASPYDERITGELIYLDSQDACELPQTPHWAAWLPAKPKIIHIDIPRFKNQNLLLIGHMNLVDKWNAVHKRFEPGTVAFNNIDILCWVEGAPAHLFLAISQDEVGSEWQSMANFWHTFQPGFTVISIPRDSFTTFRGNMDWSRPELLSFGGEQQAGTVISYQIFDGENSVLHAGDGQDVNVAA